MSNNYVTLKKGTLYRVKQWYGDNTYITICPSRNIKLNKTSYEYTRKIPCIFMIYGKGKNKKLGAFKYYTINDKGKSNVYGHINNVHIENCYNILGNIKIIHIKQYLNTSTILKQNGYKYNHKTYRLIKII